MCPLERPKHAACWLVTLVTAPYLSRTPSPDSSCTSNPAEHTVVVAVRAQWRLLGRAHSRGQWTSPSSPSGLLKHTGSGQTQVQLLGMT